MLKLLFHFLCAQLSIAALAADVRQLDFKIPELPEARVFQISENGLNIVGADVGPLNGQPVVLVPGVSANFPYLGPLIETLAASGHRVFVYNPPGQGRGRLLSGSTPANRGMTGLIKAVLLTHQYARKMTRGKSVTWMGHSMGGIEVRLASTLVQRNQVRAIFSLFSPSITGPIPALEPITLSLHRLMEPAATFTNQVDSQYESMVKISKSTLPESTTVWFETYSPSWAQKMAARLTLAATQNNVLQGVFGAPDMNLDYMRKYIEYFMAWQSPGEIITDLRTRTFKGPRGEPVLEMWNSPTLSRIPTIAIAGNKDLLSISKEIKGEAAELGYKFLELPVGHMGAFYDVQILNQVTDVVSEVTGTKPNNRALETLEREMERREQAYAPFESCLSYFFN